MSENPILSSIEKQDWLQPVQTKGEELVKNAYSAAGPAGQAVKNALHGVWLGHPLHSAITDVPVGSWTVATALDVLELRGETKYAPGADAAIMVGLLGALPAALSGLTDWSDTHGKPQRVGALHGILNMGAAAMYASSYAARKSEKRGLGRCLGFLGFSFVLASAWLGGELSYSQKIGMNHAPDPDNDLPKEYTEVSGITESDLAENKLTKGTVNGTPVLLVKQGGVVHALAETCSHLGGPLSEGQLEGDSVVCPWHGSRFCLADGHVEDGPATNNQPVLDVKLQNGKILLKSRQH
jgi:nitrite reductase/ring-hydroxylating ferredoxin subunit/uncharacterized membrane protein